MVTGSEVPIRSQLGEVAGVAAIARGPDRTRAARELQRLLVEMVGVIGRHWRQLWRHVEMVGPLSKWWDLGS